MVDVVAAVTVMRQKLRSAAICADDASSARVAAYADELERGLNDLELAHHEWSRSDDDKVIAGV